MQIRTMLAHILVIIVRWNIGTWQLLIAGYAECLSEFVRPESKYTDRVQKVNRTGRRSYFSGLMHTVERYLCQDSSSRWKRGPASTRSSCISVNGKISGNLRCPSRSFQESAGVSHMAGWKIVAWSQISYNSNPPLLRNWLLNTLEV